VGIACGWRWTYSRPGSWGGNFWLGTLGEKSYRFWLGLIVAAAAGLALFLFFVTGQE
ncbi:immunity 17 family protein, partial [Phocaeicola coprocola]